MRKKKLFWCEIYGSESIYFPCIFSCWPSTVLNKEAVPTAAWIKLVFHYSVLFWLMEAYAVFFIQSLIRNWVWTHKLWFMHLCSHLCHGTQKESQQHYSGCSWGNVIDLLLLQKILLNNLCCLLHLLFSLFLCLWSSLDHNPLLFVFDFTFMSECNVLCQNQASF